MKPKDFEVIKTEEHFQKNYALHDAAQTAGEKFLKDSGFKVELFGEDRRYEEVWEAGGDKPDCIILDNKNNKLCLLDWKGKKSSGYKINKRAYNSYLKIACRMNLPVIIAFAKLNSEKNITEFLYLKLPDDSAVTGEKLEWDKNVTVCFDPAKLKLFKEIGSFLTAE